jgi:hypothetical protein
MLKILSWNVVFLLVSWELIIFVGLVELGGLTQDSDAIRQHV